MGIPLRGLIFCCMIWLPFIGLHAQVKSIHHAKGISSVINITPEEARQKAIESAKAEALRMAGAQEWVQAFDFLDKREVNKVVDEFFHSVTSVQTMGNVLSWKLVHEEKKLDERNNISVEVTIDAEVKLYQTRPDPQFTISISGIEPVYKNNESLQFKIMPNQTGFLRVFNVDQQSVVTPIYPNPHEVMIPLEAGKTYSFPQSQYFKYEVYSDLKEEVNNMFFVFTRTNIPYTGESFESFIEYIYKIEPQERYLALEKFRIVR